MAISFHRQSEGGTTAALGAADLLCLAASPIFAVMAFLTGPFTDDPSAMLCAAMHGTTLLSGMAPMYLLMSIFHLPPWLKLAFTRR